MNKILIISAIEEEIAPLRDSSLPTHSDIELHTCGIGLVEAAFNMQKILSQVATNPKSSNTSVIFIGSVGAIKESKLNILQLVSASSAIQVDSALVRGESHMPEGLKTSVCSDDTLWNKLDSTLSGRVIRVPHISSLSITHDNTLAQQFHKKTMGSCESMELYSVAWACNKNNLPWVNLSAVTNYLNSSGQSDWIKNREKAAELTNVTLLKLLSVENDL